MHRRTILCAALLALTPSLAFADMAPVPVPPLSIAASPTVHSARSGGPTEATFVLRNDGRAPMNVRLERVTALLSRMRLPLRLTDASPARRFTLAPGQQIDVRVTFEPIEGPEARGPEWTIELAVHVEVEGDRRFGTHAAGTTTVRRVPVPG